MNADDLDNLDAKLSASQPDTQVGSNREAVQRGARERQIRRALASWGFARDEALRALGLHEEWGYEGRSMNSQRRWVSDWEDKADE